MGLPPQETCQQTKGVAAQQLCDDKALLEYDKDPSEGPAPSLAGRYDSRTIWPILTRPWDPLTRAAPHPYPIDRGARRPRAMGGGWQKLALDALAKAPRCLYTLVHI